MSNTKPTELMLFYFSRRASSIIRLQMINILFLLAVLGSYHFASSVGYVFGNVMSWMVPAVLCLTYTIVFECNPAVLDKLGLRSSDTWARIGNFIITLRVYNLVRLSLEVLGLDFLNGGICHKVGGHLNGSVFPGIHMLTDYMEVYIWTGVRFGAPWGTVFCAVELASACVRMATCTGTFADYFSSRYYPFLFIIPYYVVLAVVHAYLNMAYRENMIEIREVKTMINLRKREQEHAHRDIKLALQYVWGSLSKFKRMYKLAESMNEGKTTVARNVRAMTLVLDDTTILAALEDGALRSTSSVGVDLPTVLRELIREMEDPTVAPVNIHIALTDARAKSPILLCSETIMKSMFSNLALYIMATIRRRSLRQRFGYKPYLNVCGYSYEEIQPSGVKRYMVRVVFDHNGDIDSTEGEPSSPHLFDGTEIFQIPGRNGMKASHNIADETQVFSVRPYRVISSREVYSVNDNRTGDLQVSPLQLVVVQGVLQAHGGALSVEDFFVAGDEAKSRSMQFNRLVVDIPCLEHGPNKLPRTGRRSSKGSIPVGLTAGANDLEQMRYAVLLIDKSLQATVLSVLRSMNVHTDVYHAKKVFIGSYEFDIVKVVTERYTHALFDSEAVGIALRRNRFLGERAFFTPNSILLQSTQGNGDSYDSVLPVPCRSNYLKHYVLSSANSGTAVLSKEYSMEEDPPPVLTEHSRPAPKWIFYDIIRETVAKLCFFSIVPVMLASVSPILIKGGQRFVRGLYTTLLWALLGQIDAPICKANVPADSLVRVKFGTQFSFCGVLYGMPRFPPDMEKKFLAWRLFSHDGGIMSNSTVFVLCFIGGNICFILPMVWIGRRGPLLSWIMVAVIAAIVKFGQFFIRKDSIRSTIVTLVISFALLLQIFVTFIFSQLVLEHRSFDGRKEIRLFMGISLAVLPLMTVFFSLIYCYWRLSIFSMLTFYVRPAIFLYALDSYDGLEHEIIYSLSIAFVTLCLASFSRLYEVEFFHRVHYQALSWHRFRTFFVNTTRNSCRSDLRYPLKSLLKYQHGVLSQLTVVLMEQDKNRLQSDVFESVRSLNNGFLRLELTNSVLSFGSSVNEGLVAESLIENFQVISLREELSYFAFVLEPPDSPYTEISVMVDPRLSLIEFDRQIFRMLTINAILRALVNGRTTTPSDQLTSEFHSSTANTQKGEKPSATSPRPDIHEILIQVGFSVDEKESLSAEELIEREVVYTYLSCRSTAKSVKASGKRIMQMPYLTIAVVDNGINDYSYGAVAGSNLVCEKIVRGGFGGDYESFVLPKGSSFNNISRFTIPFRPVDIPVQNGAVGGICNGYWLSPTQSGFRGFERPLKRFEHLRRVYSKRHPHNSEEAEINNGNGDVWHRSLLMVHPDADIGKQHATAFEMEGWEYAVVTSLGGAVSYPKLTSFDMLIICTSILGVGGEQNLIPLLELNSRGFYGALICLCDGGGMPDSDISKAYHRMDIPILKSSVLSAKEMADRALLEYIVGANKVLLM